MHIWPTTVRNLLIRRAEASCGIGATEAEVRKAETAIGIRFPIEFRRYLTEFGFVTFGASELYGLGRDVPQHLHLASVTQSERSELRPCIPRHLVPVQNNGAGDHYCLDLSSPADDPPVVFWAHDESESQTPGLVSPSFTQWLLDRVKSAA